MSSPFLIEVLIQTLFSKQKEIEEYFRSQLKSHRLPIYSSIDIRQSNYKVSPVDANLFPAGFNNLTRQFKAHAVSAVRKTLQQYHPDVKIICIVPEHHTRNQFYLENVKQLQSILMEAGYQVLIGSIHEDFDDSLQTLFQKEYGIVIEKLSLCEGEVICASQKKIDLILLNNDLSGENAEFFDQAKTPVVPRTSYGWHKRQKHVHFEKYQQVADAFAKAFDIDVWSIAPMTTWQGKVNFLSGENLDQAAKKIDSLLEEIQSKYEKYKVQEKPIVFVKNNRGTYGMGITVVDRGEKLLELNRKTKNKMSKGKNKTHIDEVLIQEGVPTVLNEEGCPSEPVMYLFGSEVAGGFWRVNCEGDLANNLNRQGMTFSDFRLKPHDQWSQKEPLFSDPTYYLYTVISRLSILACTLED